MSLVAFVLRWWAAFALLACLALLGTAILIFEKWQGYPPCHLCLQQREIYWATAGVAAIGVVWGWFLEPRRTPRLIAVLILLGFAFETYMATYHAGVELKWWKGPATCTGSGSVDLSALRNLLHGGVVHAPMCDVALWKFAGVSMAGWNAVAAAILTLASLAAVLRKGDDFRG
jgi:disulfide bond formation protein DsbB